MTFLCPDSHQLTSCEDIKKEVSIKYESLRPYDDVMNMDSLTGADHGMNESGDDERTLHSMMVTPELMEMLPGASSKYGQ